LWRVAAHIQGSAILDAEVVWLDSDGVAQFDALHSRANDGAVSLPKTLSNLTRGHRRNQSKIAE